MKRYEKHLAGAFFLLVLLGLAVLPALCDAQPIYVRQGGVLKGTISPYSTSLSASDFYAYQHPNSGNASFNGPWPSLTNNRSHLFFVDALDGLSLFVVYDNLGGGGGGSATMRFDLSGDGDGAAILLQDDPPAWDTYPQTGPNVFVCQHTWGDCCTDGVVIGSLDDDWSMAVEFTTPPIGLGNGWYAYSANSGPLELTFGSPAVYTPLPVPGAAILGMIGISMVGAYTRKRRSANATEA